MDFTHCGEFGVTVGGEPFSHLLFQFVLSHSGWRYAEVAYGETFTELVSGLQGALWGLGAVPEVVRTDNLSAATHDLRDSRGRAFNDSYQAILDHYGLKATRTNPRSSHENGVAEQGHRRLKGAIGLSGRSCRVSTHTCARCLRLRCRSTSATAPGCASGAPSG